MQLMHSLPNDQDMEKLFDYSKKFAYTAFNSATANFLGLTRIEMTKLKQDARNAHDGTDAEKEQYKKSISDQIQGIIIALENANLSTECGQMVMATQLRELQLAELKLFYFNAENVSLDKDLAKKDSSFESKISQAEQFVTASKTSEKFLLSSMENVFFQTCLNPENIEILFASGVQKPQEIEVLWTAFISSVNGKNVSEFIDEHGEVKVNAKPAMQPLEVKDEFKKDIVENISTLGLGLSDEEKGVLVEDLCNSKSPYSSIPLHFLSSTAGSIFTKNPKGAEKISCGFLARAQAYYTANNRFYFDEEKFIGIM